MVSLAFRIEDFTSSHSFFTKKIGNLSDRVVSGRKGEDGDNCYHL